MVSVAAGLSAGGKIPFSSTFAKFFTRAYDQIEMAHNSGANIKIVGSHAGITLAADGPSQMSLPDVAWFQQQLQQWGFQIERTGLWDEQSRRVMMNFQMRYRPTDHRAEMDAESAALLWVLNNPVPAPKAAP
jgi:transketolase